MAKTYGIRLSTAENGASFTGLTPTMLVTWSFAAGTTIAGLAITELTQSSGFYYFSYGPTTAIYFKVDFGAGLPGGFRFVEGILDPIQAVDDKVGFLTDSFGSSTVDPTTLFAYTKRLQELLEGNATFNKSTGVWDIYSRGSTTLLREKTLTNTSSAATKT